MNLFTGDRGLMSYIEKKELQEHFEKKRISLTNQIIDIEAKNSLLSENLNFDFMDTLIREKLKFGNKEEILIKLND